MPRPRTIPAAPMTLCLRGMPLNAPRVTFSPRGEKKFQDLVLTLPEQATNCRKRKFSGSIPGFLKKENAQGNFGMQPFSSAPNTRKKGLGYFQRERRKDPRVALTLTEKIGKISLVDMN
ncbi:hypothetical protein ACJJTC_009207 [Scirpophaga incertulas]